MRQGAVVQLYVCICFYLTHALPDRQSLPFAGLLPDFMQDPVKDTIKLLSGSLNVTDALDKLENNMVHSGNRPFGIQSAPAATLARPRARFTSYSQVAQSSVLKSSSDTTVTLNIPIGDTRMNVFRTMGSAPRHVSGTSHPRQWLVKTSKVLDEKDKAVLQQQLKPYLLGDYVPDNTYQLTAPFEAVEKIQPVTQRLNNMEAVGSDGLVTFITELHPIMKFSLGLNPLKTMNMNPPRMVVMNTPTISTVRTPVSEGQTVIQSHPSTSDSAMRRKTVFNVIQQLYQDLTTAAQQNNDPILPSTTDVREYVTMTVTDKVNEQLSITVHSLDADAYPGSTTRDVNFHTFVSENASYINQEQASILLQQRSAKVAKVLAEHPLVHWIERRASYKSMNKYSNVILQSGKFHQKDSTPFWTKGLKGRGIVVAVADTGVDHDNCYFYDPKHKIPFNTFNPSHRKIVAYHTSEQISPRDTIGGDQIDGHGTHTGGTIAGEPLEHPEDPDIEGFKGIAYKAKLAVFDYQHPTAQPDEMVLPDDVYNDYLLRARNDYGVSITSNSWGDVNGLYDSFSRAIDLFSWRYPDFQNCFAVGNTGVMGRYTAASPALAKNVMAVGSTSNSPLSFFERGLDGGMRVTRVPTGITISHSAGELKTREVPYEFAITPANFGKAFRELRSDSIANLMVSDPVDACRILRGMYSGAVVMVTRGTCPFTTKAANLQRAGALVMMLVNNEPGTETEVMYASGSARPQDYNSISSVMVAKVPGDRLLQVAKEGGMQVLLPLPYIQDGHHEHRLSSFSSRGPTKDGRIKPDVLAPGEYIVSARSDGDLNSFQCNSKDGSTLKAMQGTSMAAPAVAAAAALAREYFMKGYYPSGEAKSPYGVLQLTPTRLRSDDAEEPEADPEASVFSRVTDGITNIFAEAFGFSSAGAEQSPLHADSFVPSAALLKALLVHSAVAVGGPVKTESSRGSEIVTPPPSIYQGWGRVKLDNVQTFHDDVVKPAVFVLDYSAEKEDKETGGASNLPRQYTGETVGVCFNITELVHNSWAFKLPNKDGKPDHPFRYDFNTSGSTGEAFPFGQNAMADPFLKVTLAYTDYPSALASSTQLVNDLDLTVTLTAQPRTTGKWATAMFTGNHGADDGGNTSGRDDMSTLFDESKMAKQFYSPWTPQSSFTFTGHPSDDSYVREVRGKKGWDHKNNIETVFISSLDMLDVAAETKGVSPAARRASAAKLVKGEAEPNPFGIPASPAVDHEYLLGAFVHGTAVPHGPQPFAQVVSSLYGGIVTLPRLPSNVCGAAQRPDPLPIPTITPPTAVTEVDINHVEAKIPVITPENTVSTMSEHSFIPAAKTAALCPNQCSNRGTCMSNFASASGLQKQSLWGCVCDAPFAGADCSHRANVLPGHSNTHKAAAAYVHGLLHSVTLQPGQTEYFYTYVPPRSEYSSVSNSDSKEGLSIHFVRESHQGDADLYILSPPVHASELSRDSDTGTSTSASPVTSGHVFRLGPLASAPHALTEGGWPSEKFHSYMQIGCDNCYDDLLDLALSDFNFSGGPSIKVTQKVLIPYRNLPSQGGVFRVAVHAPCCDSVTIQQGASFVVPLNMIQGKNQNQQPELVSNKETTEAQLHSAAMLSSVNNARIDPTFTPGDTYFLPLPVITTNGYTESSNIPLSDMDKYIPLQKRAISTEIRLNIDLRNIPSNIHSIFAQEVSAQLGIDDGPCRVVLTEVTRVPGRTPVNTEASVEHQVDSMQYVHVSQTMQRNVGNKLVLKFLILPPVSMDAMLQRSSTDFDPTLITSSRQFTYIQELLLGQLTTCSGHKATSAAQSSVDKQYQVLQAAYDMAAPSSTYTVFDITKPHSTMAMPSVLPLSSLILTQADVSHKPPYNTVIASLCNNGTYSTTCETKYIYPTILVDPFFGISKQPRSPDPSTTADTSLDPSKAHAGIPIITMPESDDQDMNSAAAQKHDEKVQKMYDKLAVSVDEVNRPMTPIRIGLIVIVSFCILALMAYAVYMFYKKMTTAPSSTVDYRVYRMQASGVELEFDQQLEDNVSHQSLLVQNNDTSTTPKTQNIEMQETRVYPGPRSPGSRVMLSPPRGTPRRIAETMSHLQDFEADLNLEDKNFSIGEQREEKKDDKRARQ